MSFEKLNACMESGFFLPQGLGVFFTILLVAAVIIVVLLKGLALWRAAKRDQKVWFWVLIFVNTAGILEIIYLLTNQEKKEKKTIEVTEEELGKDIPEEIKEDKKD